jgi:hypothetical protein
MKPAIAQGTLLCLPLLAYALGTAAVPDRPAIHSALDEYAREYAGLVADLSELNAESVDFQIPDWRARARIRATSLPAVRDRSQLLANHVRETYGRSPSAGERARHLAGQLNALAWRSAQLAGQPLTFEQELSQFFALDAGQIDTRADGTSMQARAELDERLPGNRSLSQRLADYHRRFIVSRGRLDAVFTAAVEACRNQTRRHITLPQGERVTIEYVADQPWSAYSTYRGGYHSLIRVNREAPMTVGQALNLACHEGYPGHHVYNSLRDQRFVRERGWFEMTVLPLFSPEGFRAEAAASAAAAVVFRSAERADVLRERLFPLAGLDPRDAEHYVQVADLVDSLAGDTTAVVAQYLAGALSARDAANELQRRALMAHPEPLLAYLERYGDYALAYTWGRDRLLAGPDAQADRSAFLSTLMTSSEWDLGGQQ